MVIEHNGKRYSSTFLLGRTLASSVLHDSQDARSILSTAHEQWKRAGEPAFARVFVLEGSGLLPEPEEYFWHLDEK